MRLLKLLSVALMVSFTLGAVVSATASAEEIGVLPTPVGFTSEGDNSNTFVHTFETTKGGKIECNTLTNKGEMKTDLEGKVTIDYEKNCALSGSKCSTAGDAAGTLLFPVLILAVDIGLNAKMESVLSPGAVVKLKEDLKIKCGILQIEVLGAVLGGLYKSLGGEEFKSLEKTKTAFLVFNQEKGMQLFETCVVDFKNCEEGKIKYKLEANFGKGEELAGELSDDVITFAKEVEFHF